VIVLHRGHNSLGPPWSNYLAGDPHKGLELFREKGCGHCHAINGAGGGNGPDLGYQQPATAGVNQLVVAMWNHAPKMWEEIAKEKVHYPEINDQEMAHVFAYLYTARDVDEPGDALRGGQLFRAKKCIACHSIHQEGGKIGPDLSAVGNDAPIAWAHVMWNHGPAMEDELRKLGMEWPEFQENQMNDLLAYLREVCSGPRHEDELLPADPERGWQVFRSKSCIVCHAVKGEGGHVGPELAPRHDRPITYVQFAGLMWDHSPQMYRQMQTQKIARPTFSDREMADLIAFLNSLGYFEPGGSLRMGEILFTRRGCSDCHGPEGQGTSSGPPLRGRGRNFTTVTFAGALWRHGEKMNQRTRQINVPWPKLQESDVGDLLIFLNTPPAENRAHAQTHVELGARPLPCHPKQT
jgi:cytochrome c2